MGARVGAAKLHYTPVMPDTPVEQVDPATDDETVEPIKRPVCRGTGFLFQSVGALFALATCCLWPAAHWWQNYSTTATGGISIDPLRDSTVAQRFAMGGVAISFLGGMLLVALGLGLQHDRLRTGRWPMVVTAAGAAYFWVYFGFCVAEFPAAFSIALLAALSIVWTVLFVLAGVSAEELRRIPPTPSERGWTSIDADDLKKLTSPRQRDKTNP